MQSGGATTITSYGGDEAGLSRVCMIGTIAASIHNGKPLVMPSHVGHPPKSQVLVAGGRLPRGTAKLFSSKKKQNQAHSKTKQ
jgi:hypothetical protein